MPHFGEPTPEGPGKRRFCRITTGQYTGDGTESQAITGIGFKPKIVIIHEHVTIEGDGYLSFLKTDQMFSSMCYTPYVGRYDLNRLISLDADGFTVDDDGANQPPNELGILYDYVAWG